MIFEDIEFFDPKKGIDNPLKVQKLFVEWDSEVPFLEMLATFLKAPKLPQVKNLIIGQWFDETAEELNEVIEQLIVNADKLQGIEGLFVADLTAEESEISWIQQEDMTPLLTVLPNLKTLIVKGGEGLRFSNLTHKSLETLIVQTGGLDVSVVEDIQKAQLPSLSYLSIWLGDSNYGANTKAEDLKPLLSGELFPKLSHLGLMNSEIANELAEALKDAPILERLDILDLSMGVMQDKGATHLLDCKLDNLQFFNLSNNFLSKDMIDKLKQKWANIEVVATGQKEPWKYDDGDIQYYVDVSE